MRKRQTVFGLFFGLLPGLCLILMIATTIGALLGTAAPIDDEAFKRNRAWADDFYKGRSNLSTRVNGVKLDADASIGKSDPEGLTPNVDEVQVKWTLDYTGPRPPLTILWPSMLWTDGQTLLVFYAEDINAKVYEYEVASTPSQYPVGLGYPAKSFLTIEKGKSASRTLTYPLADVLSHFKGRKDNPFGDKPPTRFSVQVTHKPKARGMTQDGHLDAWTGEVLSPVCPLKLPKK